MDKQNISARQSSSISISLIILATIGVFYVLVVGKTFLVPLAVAVMVWYIINALSRTFARFTPRVSEPNAWTMLLSIVSIGLLTYFAVDMVRDNILTFQKLRQLIKRILTYWRVKSLVNLV